MYRRLNDAGARVWNAFILIADEARILRTAASLACMDGRVEPATQLRPTGALSASLAALSLQHKFVAAAALKSRTGSWFYRY
jgi:hypothetical protein